MIILLAHPHGWTRQLADFWGNAQNSSDFMVLNLPNDLFYIQGQITLNDQGVTYVLLSSCRKYIHAKEALILHDLWRYPDLMETQYDTQNLSMPEYQYQLTSWSACLQSLLSASVYHTNHYGRCVERHNYLNILNVWAIARQCGILVPAYYSGRDQQQLDRFYQQYKVCYQWKSWHSNVDFSTYTTPEIDVLLHVAKQAEVLYRCVVIGNLCFVKSLVATEDIHEVGQIKLQQGAIRLANNMRWDVCEFVFGVEPLNTRPILYRALPSIDLDGFPMDCRVSVLQAIQDYYSKLNTQFYEQRKNNRAVGESYISANLRPRVGLLQQKKGA